MRLPVRHILQAALIAVLALPALPIRSAAAQQPDQRPGLIAVQFTTSGLPDSVGRLAAGAVRESEAATTVARVVPEADVTRVCRAHPGVGSDAVASVAAARDLKARIIVTGRVEKVSDEFFVVSVSLADVDATAGTMRAIKSVTRELTSLTGLRDAVAAMTATLIEAWVTAPAPGSAATAFPADQLLVFAVSYVQRGNAGAQDDALVQAFRDRGVPAEQIVYLKNDAATLAAMRSSLAALVSKSDEDSLLVIYFNGAGSRFTDGRTFLSATNTDNSDIAGTAWSTADMASTIESGFQGTRVVGAFDCGNADWIALALATREGRVRYSTIGSRAATQSGPKGWTFTNCLIDAVTGHPRVDANGDGTVTVGEWMSETDRRMVFVERLLPFLRSSEAIDELPLAVTKAPAERANAHCWTRYEFHQNDVWMRCRVTELVGDGNAKVRFLNNQPATTVPLSRLRQWAPETLAKDTVVNVYHRGSWWEAKVTMGRHGLYHVFIPRLEEGLWAVEGDALRRR